MHFILFLTFEGVKFDACGPFVDYPYETNEKIIYYQLTNDWDDIDLFYDDGAIDEIAHRCNSLISYGEADYFNAEKCAILLQWVEDRLSRPCTPRYNEMLEVLRDFCHRAVELNTGVVIDF